MTIAIAADVARRRAPRSSASSPFARLADLCDELIARATDKSVDPSGYREDILGFARDFLGYVACSTVEDLEIEIDRQLAAGVKREDVRVLWPRQVDILVAIQNNKRVAVRSGQKVSKSFTVALACLWFYTCFHEARVALTAPTARQVDGVIWREVRKLRAKARREIEGEIGELARTGLKSHDFRELTGFTAREVEAVAGVSGANLMYVADEASGVEDIIFEAMKGNMAGGTAARMLLLSNPTKTTGEFFEAFHGKSEFYAPIHISSLDSPNAITGKTLIPGLASREWIDERKREYGEDSAFFKVRVLGDFVRNEEGKIVSLHMLEQAQERWSEASSIGRLHIGLDPAGPGGGGDDSAFCVRRGKKVLNVFAKQGLSTDAHLTHLLEAIRAHARPRDLPAIVVLDRDGSLGAEIGRYLEAYLNSVEGSGAFELVQVRSSNRAVREPLIYDRVRDELWAAGAAWLRAGGAIPSDVRLERELHAPEWFQVVSGLQKVTAKDDLRKALKGRSPDFADAFNLAVWDPVSFREVSDAAAPGAAETARAAREHVQRAELASTNVFRGPAALDPYAGEDAWRRR